MNYKMDKKTIVLLATALIASLTGGESEADLQSRTANADFVKDCPSTWDVIRDNNVTEYAVDCKYFSENNGKVTEEKVSGYACFIVKNLLWYLCEKNISVPRNLLNLTISSDKSICPFNFTQLNEYKLFQLGYLGIELTKPEQCAKVCNDLYEVKSQCIILKKVYNFVVENIYSNNNNNNMNRHFQGVKSFNASSLPAEHVYVNGTEESLKINEKPSAEISTTSKKVYNFPTKLNTGNINVTTSVKPLGLNIAGSKPSSFKKFNEELMQSSSKASKPSDYSPATTSRSKSSNIEKMKTSTASVNIATEDLQFKNENPVNDYESNESVNDGFEMNSEIQEENIYKEKKISGDKTPFQQTLEINEISGKGFFQAEDSHLFFYFLMLSSVIIIGYLAFHNKNKILAYAIEGSNSRRNRRRPNPARYRKLESNLEEAISSSTMQSTACAVVY